MKQKLPLHEQLIDALKNSNIQIIRELLEKKAHHGCYTIKFELNLEELTFQSAQKQLREQIDRTQALNQCVLVLSNKTLYFLDCNHQSLQEINAGHQEQEKTFTALKKKCQKKAQFKDGQSETLKFLVQIAPEIKPILNQHPNHLPFLCYGTSFTSAELLFQNGINPNIGTFKRTLRYQLKKMKENLIKIDESMFYVNKNGKNTIFHYYIENLMHHEKFFTLKFAQLLEKHGVDLNAINHANASILELLCKEETINYELVHYLLKSNNKPQIIDMILKDEFFCQKSLPNSSGSAPPNLGLITLLMQFNPSKEAVSHCIDRLDTLSLQEVTEKLEKNLTEKIFYAFILCDANFKFNPKFMTSYRVDPRLMKRIVLFINQSEDNINLIQSELKEQINTLFKNKKNLKSSDTSFHDSLLQEISESSTSQFKRSALSFFCITNRFTNETKRTFPKPIKTIILDYLIEKVYWVKKLERLNSEAIDIIDKKMNELIETLGQKNSIREWRN